MDKQTEEYRKDQLNPVVADQKENNTYNTILRVVSGNGKASKCLDISLDELIQIRDILTK